jgi:hypothetical protein
MGLNIVHPEGKVILGAWSRSIGNLMLVTACKDNIQTIALRF